MRTGPAFSRRALCTTVACFVLTVVVVACGGADDASGDADRPTTGTRAPMFDGSSGSVIAIVGDAGELNDDTLAVASLIEMNSATAVFTVGDN